MSVNAPFQVAPDRRCFVVYLGENGDDTPTELHGTHREVKREAQRRMDAARAAHGSSSLRERLTTVLPLRRRSSAAAGGASAAPPPSAINLLDLPVEILDAVLAAVGAKNFYDEPARLLVCKRWHRLVRPLLQRHVVLDVNSLLRFVPPARGSRVRRLLPRRRSSVASAKGDDAAETGVARRTAVPLAQVQCFDVDLRVINGFITKNNVPVERNNDYKRWKANIDSSFAILAGQLHTLVAARTVRIRAWAADCHIAEAYGRPWHRLARDAILDLQRDGDGGSSGSISGMSSMSSSAAESLRSASMASALPRPLALPRRAHRFDRVELDLCGAGFAFVMCDGRDAVSPCAAVRTLLGRTRVLHLRLQSMCVRALTPLGETVPGTALPAIAAPPAPVGADAGAATLREEHSDDIAGLEELVVNRDTREAHPWSASGSSGGRCMRPLAEGAVAADHNHGEIVAALRRLVPRLAQPRMVRFLWLDNGFERKYDPTAALPVNRDGKLVYTGSVAYDLLTERVSRLGFLAPWDAEGRLIDKCPGHLWEKGAEALAAGEPGVGGS